MKNSHRFLMTASFAAVVTLSSLGVAAFAQKESINPGLNPSTGQINPGTEPQAPSQSAEVEKIPTPEEARAAMMQPISRQPSAGNAANGTTGSGGQQPPMQNASGASNELVLATRSAPSAGRVSVTTGGSCSLGAWSARCSTAASLRAARAGSSRLSS